MAEPAGNGPHSPRKRASIHTLGCRLNQAESRMLEEQLRAAGYEIVPFGQPAELGIIHTCVVTREAETKSRKYIHRFLRQNPGAVTAVIGCYAQTAAEAIAAMGGVDLVLGNDAKMLLSDYLDLPRQDAPVVLRPRPERKTFTIRFEPDGPPLRQRVNLKIQDGCDTMCSYCYIPFARGRSRSRDFGDILNEATALVHRGAKEIVLTGVNLGDFEQDGRRLADLVDALSALAPQPRVRISSIELTNLPETLFERMADPAHALVPHLHVPLQSGSDTVLQAMRRPYTAADYLALLGRAAAAVPGIGIGADVMVGFPGETDADFEATCALVRESPLFYLHVFQYSERPEVASVRLEDKVPVETAGFRSEVLIQIGEEKKRAFLEHQIGKTLRVLFEDCEGEHWRGHADNYLEVAVESKEDLRNRFGRVRINALQGRLLFGTIKTME